jgi:hypothetical protein
MRFIVAALAAFLVLMIDIDPSPSAIASDAPTIKTAPVSLDSASDAVPFATRFTGTDQINEEPITMAADAAAPAPASAPDDATAAPQAPTTDAFCQALKEAAEASQIPLAFFARLIWQESGFNRNEVSHAGAQGVAQFMPETAAEIGLDDPFDPLKALPASARLLRKLRDDFGNLGLAAAAYNAGSGRIQKWLAKQSDLPQETRNYVRIITGTKAEDWIEDAGTLAIRADLPRDAPCDGVGGLSKSKDVTFVHAAPAPAVAMIIHKAEAEAEQRAAKASSARARRRLALQLEKSARGTTRPGRLHQLTVAHSRAKLRGHSIRVALRERSSG